MKAGQEKGNLRRDDFLQDSLQSTVNDINERRKEICAKTNPPRFAAVRPILSLTLCMHPGMATKIVVGRLICKPNLTWETKQR